MKRLIFLISLLITGQALAYGTAKEDTSTAITFVHSVGMDSVRYYASQDTTSWEIGRLMVRAFSPDSTNYALIDTFDNPGTYFVKIEYWEGGAASAKYLPDIRDVAPANADVNMVQISGDATAADNFETMLDGTGGNTLTLKTLGIYGVSDTAVVIKSGGAHGIYVQGGTSGDAAVWIEAGSGAGKPGLYIKGDGGGAGAHIEGGGTNSDGLMLVAAGTGIDLNAPDLVDLIFDEDTTGHGTAKSFAVMLKDTSAYQGAGSSAEGIKDAVWGQTVDTAFTAGTMGDSAKVWGRIGGSGPRLCSLFVSDVNDKAITDGSTRMTSGATTYTADISGDGFAVYSLTDATWKMLAYATGFVQDTIPQTFTVSASFKDTLTMTVVSIPNPSGADKVTCYIDTYDIMGALVENAKLTATVSDNGPWFAVDDSSAIMIPKTVSARTNSSGRATIELWESAEVRNEKNDNPTFNFILEKSRHFKWSIEDRSTPDADTWQIK